MQKPKHAHVIENNDFSWFNITQNTSWEINWLKNNFDFSPFDLQDCLPPNQRAKLVEYPNYLFMILLFPVYHRQSREIKAAEVDFFIGRNFIITVHNNELAPLREFFHECEKSGLESILEEGPANLLYEIINRLLNYCFPMLVHITNDIEQINSQILNSHGVSSIKEMILVKRNIVTFRQTMVGHKNVIRQLVEKTGRFFPNLKLNLYFQNLLEQTQEIWDTLETNKETINALHEARMSLSSYRLNQIIKTLTIFSVIFIPLNFIAFLFGMKTNYTPIVGAPFDFWIITFSMVIIALVLLIVFKKKKWL